MKTHLAPDGVPATRAAERSALDIAVIGSGISGLSAAWLLSQKHEVTLFEADHRAGGHSHTVDVPAIGGTDRRSTPASSSTTRPTYPNLTRAVGPPERADPADARCRFAVSLDDGALEYSGSGLRGLFAQPRNLASPRFWSMLRDLVRFYRQAPAATCRDCDRPDAAGRLPRPARLRRAPSATTTCCPMAAAIWSTPAAADRQLSGRRLRSASARTTGCCSIDRPRAWRTVQGGSRELRASSSPRRSPTGCGCDSARGAEVRARRQRRRCAAPAARRERFDHVVIATHADQALACCDDASAGRAAAARRLPLQPQPAPCCTPTSADAAAAARSGRAGTTSADATARAKPSA